MGKISLEGRKGFFRLNRLMRGFTTYIKLSVAEMQKVVWPTRKQAIQLSILIVIVSLILGVILAGLDTVWRTALKSLILRIP